MEAVQVGTLRGDHGTFKSWKWHGWGLRRQAWVGDRTSVGMKAAGACGSSSQVTMPRAALECLTLTPQVEWGDLAKGLRTAQRKPGTPR